MNSTETKPVESRSFLPAEIQVPVAPQPPIAASASTSRRREGARINLRGEIGRDSPISLAAVKNLVLRHPEETPKMLVLNSGGGSISEAFRVYEWLHALPVPLAIVADTRCCSASVIILMAADLRIANPGTQILLHGTHIDTESFPSRLNAKDLQRYIDDLKGDDDRVCDLLSARTGSDRDRFEAEMADEFYMSEAVAVELGVIHEWRGLDRPVDPTWPEAARQIRAAGMILPPRLLSPSYMSACRMAEHFPVVE